VAPEHVAPEGTDQPARPMGPECVGIAGTARASTPRRRE
jgi:hypothetical protein